MLATLLLSQGVPMILHGDEVGRTQEGDNNTYAQDSEISWMHWDQLDLPLLEFTATLARLRADHPTFRRKQFFNGLAARVGEEQRLNDIVWLRPDGNNMEDGDWSAHDARAIGMYLNGQGIAGKDATGNRIVDQHALVYFNGGPDPVELTLPPEEYSEQWEVAIDTAGEGVEPNPLPAGGTRTLAGRSVLVLMEHTGASPEPRLSVAASVEAMTEMTG
jgi:glycogen operon protein